MAVGARRSLRVTHVVPALFGTNGVIGGAERYVLELARHMAEHVDTTVLSFGHADEERRDGELRIRVLGGARHVRGQAANPFSLALIAALRHADVVHCHQQHVLASSVAALVCRTTGRRVVCTDLGGGGWDVCGYVSTDRWFHKHLHISEYSRRVFNHAPSPRATVILGGVDASRFVPPSDSAERDIECLFVGRVLPHKGIDRVIEALPEGVRLLVVGPAPDARYLGDLHRLAEGRRVQFIHDCDDRTLVSLYQRARVVLLPSVYVDRYGTSTNVPELLGQTLLEAMACGAATICTDVASLPEIVVHGETGLIVPPADSGAMRAALSWMATHPADAGRMGGRGRARVLDMFTWPAVVNRCLDAYAD
jgi:glycosyltransferase involved in cell wall biosynthesis